LAPDYEYDSTEAKSPKEINPQNQLPPLVQVTMVAIDETSAARLSPGTRGSASAPVPDLGLNRLFKKSADFDEDLKTLGETLVERRLLYRVFTTHVSIRAAKWSRE
jgi:uncharacterized protein (TIGR02599 family)